MDTRGRAAVYKAHIRSTMEYAPLSWMSASETHLRRLDDIQHRASRIIGPAAQLEPLSHQRLISGLGLLHRMHKPEQPQVLQSILPPKLSSARLTRSNCGEQALQPLAGRTRSGKWSLQQYDRSFLPAIIPVWNSLPQTVIGDPVTEKKPRHSARGHIITLIDE